MISHFKSIATSFVSAKKEVKAYKPEEKIGYIEKDLDDGKINLSQAMGKLRELMRYDLDDNDYREIEKQVSYNVK